MDNEIKQFEARRRINRLLASTIAEIDIQAPNDKNKITLQAVEMQRNNLNKEIAEFFDRK